jgi:hypothetical protein
MAARGAKLSAAQHRAIEALLENPGVPDAALAAGVEHDQLVRWRRDPDFNAALLKAQSAGLRQSMMRLRQGSNAAAVTIVNTMQRGKTPAVRLKAVKSVLRLAQDALAMQQFAADVDQEERARQGAAPANKQPGIRGHGAKFSRLQEKAIAALLTQHSIADAARATGVGRPAFYRWMADPGFQARLGAAARIAFGDATRSLLLGVNYAVTLLGKLSGNAISTPRFTVTKPARLSKRKIWERAWPRCCQAVKATQTVSPRRNPQPSEGVFTRHCSD